MPHSIHTKWNKRPQTTTIDHSRCIYGVHECTLNWHCAGIQSFIKPTLMMLVMIVTDASVNAHPDRFRVRRGRQYRNPPACTHKTWRMCNIHQDWHWIANCKSSSGSDLKVCYSLNKKEQLITEWQTQLRGDLLHLSYTLLLLMKPKLTHQAWLLWNGSGS